MKKRIISGIVMLLIVIPIIMIGGLPFKILTIIFALFSLKEFLNARKNLPKLIKVIACFFMAGLFVNSLNFLSWNYLAYLFLILSIFVVYYHDYEKYSAFDTFYVFAGIIIILLPCQFIISLRAHNFNILIYLLLITVMTDTYAYIVGCLIGKHKLIESISPYKTIEGLIGGLVGGVVTACVFYVINFDNVNIFYLFFQTSILSLLCQFGDLFFSSLKRLYKIKDYSNLIPGHGGILDRIDGFIFVLLGYLLFL